MRGALDHEGDPAFAVNDWKDARMKRLLLTACLLAPTFAPTLAHADDDLSAPTADCAKGVLTLHILKPQNNPPFPAQLDLFKASNKCIAFDIAEVPFGQLADKISVLAASGTPPDIVVYDGPNTQSYASAGILLPLDPYLPAGLKDDIIGRRSPSTATRANCIDGTSASQVAFDGAVGIAAAAGLVAIRPLTTALCLRVGARRRTADARVRDRRGARRHRRPPLGAPPARLATGRLRDRRRRRSRLGAAAPRTPSC